MINIRVTLDYTFFENKLEVLLDTKILKLLTDTEDGLIIKTFVK